MNVNKSYLFRIFDFYCKNSLRVEGQAYRMQMSDLYISIIFSTFIGPILIALDLFIFVICLLVLKDKLFILVSPAYSSFLLYIGDHDYDAAIFLPDHFPKVAKSIRHGTLGRYVCIRFLVALK